MTLTSRPIDSSFLMKFLHTSIQRAIRDCIRLGSVALHCAYDDFSSFQPIGTGVEENNVYRDNFDANCQLAKIQ